MSTSSNTAVVHRFVEDVLNQGMYELLDELWDRDLVWRGGSLGEVHGLDAYRDMLEASARGAFTGMRLTIHQTVAQDDTVALLFTNSGIHTGDFMGTPPTGRHASWLGSGFYRLRDNKIVEATFAEDILGLLRQLTADDTSPRREPHCLRRHRTHRTGPTARRPRPRVQPPDHRACPRRGRLHAAPATRTVTGSVFDPIASPTPSSLPWARAAPHHRAVLTRRPHHRRRHAPPRHPAPADRLRGRLPRARTSAPSPAWPTANSPPRSSP
ncbi:ester cyclase [Streptomyces sp. M19]